MIKKLLYRLMSNIKALFKGVRITDDFDWELYHYHYQGEITGSEKKYTRVLSENDYFFQNSELLINKQILPLHPNCRLLYETILQLSPSSILEIGCGGGDNLWNISVLYPNTKLYGRDISVEQIKFLRNRHPQLNAEIKQLDVTLPHPLNSTKVDIVFTQAVIMHIKTGNSHLVALANLFNYATKQIILMENWNSHNFKDDIDFLFSKHMLCWNEVFVYYRDSIELKKPHIIVVSSEPLRIYKQLEDYSILK